MELWNGIADMAITIFGNVISLLKTVSAGGISMWSITIVFMVLSILISVFWRGGGA